MKFHFKAMLAAFVLPAGIATTFFSTNIGVDKTATVAEMTRPYIVEVYDSAGTKTGDFSGTSTKLDVFAVATELGAAPFPEDKYTSFPDIRMGMGGKISIYRAPLYRIIDGRRESDVRSWQTSVGGLLSERKIEIGDDDKINFSADTELEADMQIRIIRVAVTTLHVTEAVDYTVIKKEDKTLDKGKINIQQKGVDGVRTLSYLVRREDGIEVSRTLTANEITTPAVDEIQIIGTKPAITGWCKYNDWVLAASIQNGLDPDKLCNLMKIESWGHADSIGQGGAHLGLFQYDPGFWSDVSAKAGYSGADIFDARSQIYVTAWALTHGYAGRW